MPQDKTIKGVMEEEYLPCCKIHINCVEPCYECNKMTEGCDAFHAQNEDD